MHDALTTLKYDNSFELETLYKLIETPSNSELGDYAIPCFIFSKIIRKSPHQISQQLSQIIHDMGNNNTDIITSINALGPYINFHISKDYMASITLPQIVNGRYFSNNRSSKKERIMIEYSQPNTHKGFHVGHIRNVALGDSLCRIYRYNGYDVVSANYIGDVGSHIAKCLWYYLNHNTEPIPEYFKGEWLGTLYTKATLKLANDPPEKVKKYNEEISKILQKLENRDPELQTIWKETRQWSLKDFEEIYEWLDNKFDVVFYESEFDESGKKLILEYLQKGVFERSEGAIGIDLNDVDLRYFLLLKSDGNTLYSTKDIVLGIKKFDEFKIDRSIYIVGAEQTLHFQQVFETLKRMGYHQAEKCFHLVYSLVVLPSGKMSSRTGNIILFSKLRDEIIQYVRNNYLNEYEGKWSESEIEKTTKRIAVAAIKYGMLKQSTNQNIVFSMKDWLKTQGDTGVYLIYVYVRIRSILKKVNIELRTDVDFRLLSHPNEKLLIRQLYDFNEIVLRAGKQYGPSLLTTFLYEMAKTFNRVYKECSVVRASSDELQFARLLLFYCVAEILKQGLYLLGITPPERM